MRDTSKGTRLAEYKEQSRGGVGSKGAVTRDADFIEEIFSATNHNWLLIFHAEGALLLDADF